MPEATSSTTPRPRPHMPKTFERSSEIREDVVASLKQAQQLTLDAVTTWVDVMSKVTPELPTVPFLPARSEVVEGVATLFEMAEELLESQRKFAVDLVGVLVPTT